MHTISSNESSSTGNISLNELVSCAKGKPFGCRSCKLFQYSPTFKRSDRESYLATLDSNRFDKKNNSFCMPGMGDDGAEVLVVLDSPSKPEDADGSSFSGGAARIIRRNAKQVGINLDSWHWEYLVKCVPPDDKLTLANATYCSGFLAKYISDNRPRVIVTFGAIALQAILGKSDANIAHFVCRPQEAVVAGHPCVVYPMQAPWYILRNDYLAGKYLDQFQQLQSYLSGETVIEKDTSVKSIITDVDRAIALCHRLIQKVNEGKSIDADLETSGLNPYLVGAKITTVSLGCSSKRGYSIMVDHKDCQWEARDRKRFLKKGLRPLLQHPSIKLRWHNGKFDVQWIKRHFGFFPRDQIEDTMLTHYSFDENEEHGLKPLSLRYTDMGDYDAELEAHLREQPFEDKPRYDLVPYELLGKYAAMDVVATRKLHKVFKPLVEEQGESVSALAYRVMPALSATLTRMEINGAHVDTEFARNKVIPFLTKAAEESYSEIISNPTVRQFIRDGEAAARAKMKKPKPIEVKQYFSFSLGSPKQLQTLLYDPKYFGHEPQSFSTTGAPSTDKEAMYDLAALGSPIAKAILEWRGDDKIVGTYGQPIIDRLSQQDDGLLHGSYLAHGTKTGRLSSKNPNLQNFPNKSGGVIKRLFDSRYGDDGVFIQVDFSQIELRLLAAMSGDKNMIEAYRLGKDLHTLTACLIFGYTEEQFKALPKNEQKRIRTVAKRINFGLCIAEGSSVLTERRGFVPIEDVRDDDRLWDGVEWVNHGGVVCTGVKDVIDIGGVWCTPEHEVLTDEGWMTAWHYAQRTNHLLSGHRMDDGRFVISPTVVAEGSHQFKLFAPADLCASSTEIAATISCLVSLSSASGAEQHRAGESTLTNSEGTHESLRTPVFVSRGSEGTDAYLIGATTRNAEPTLIMEGEGYPSTRTCRTGLRSCDMSSRSLGTTTESCNLTELTMTATTHPETSECQRLQKTYRTPADPTSSHTEGVSCACPIFGKPTALGTGESAPFVKSCYVDNHRRASLRSSPVVEVRTRKVYDIRSAGPRCSFQAGGHIVHNCYGIGSVGVQGTLKADGVIVSEDEAQSYLDGFARSYETVMQWIENIENSTMSDEHSLSAFGRRRRLEAVRSADFKLVSRSLRQAVNHAIQSTAGDLTSTAMILFDQEICLRRGDDPRLLLPTIQSRDFTQDDRWSRVHLNFQVHDMIGVDAHKDVAADVVDRLLDTMQNVVDYAPMVWGDWVAPRLERLRSVPIIAEAEVGPNWRDAYGVKSGKDVPKAMFIANEKKKVFDENFTFEWMEEHTNEAKRKFEALAS